MEPETVWRSLYALYGFWATRSQADIDAGRIGILRSEYLSTMPGLPAEERARWFKLVTWEAADLQARVRRDYSIAEPKYWDVLPFEERPLIAFDDLVLCPSLPLMRRMPGNSLQHRLQDREVFTETETRRFRDTRGLIVERYTSDTFTRAFKERFISEAQLQQYAGGNSVCDGIIVYPDALILLEYKTASPLLDNRHAANYAAYRRQWGERMSKAATQFVSTISLLRAGVFGPLGMDAAVRWDLFPVVAVFEQPVQALTYRKIRDVDLAGHPLSAMMESGDVRPFQLLHIREVESWETAVEQGRSPLDLLREKVSRPNSTEISFHHFIHLKGETFQKNHSAWQAARFEEITESAKQYWT